MKTFILSKSRTAVSLAAWLVIWHVASLLIGQEMLLASPVSVAGTLLKLLVTSTLWRSVLFSVTRIALGFICALFSGLLFACVAYFSKTADAFLKPPMAVLKTAPVASYIIICLIYMPSSRLSAVISFTMALPVIYLNALTGLRSIDSGLLEMAQVYNIGIFRRLLFIYLPQTTPFILSACALSLGMSWKAGVAAEVIGLPSGSIGERLYMAKIFVDTKSTLAWTFVVIALSWLFEHSFLALFSKLVSRLERL